MTTYKYLGYGITNENGVAQLKYDENGDELDHSYTGVGAGEIDVIASLDKPITDGSIVSETYSLHDCKFYDKAILNDPQTNDNWTTITKLHRYDTYTSYEGTPFSNTRIKINSSENIPMGEYCVEITVLENTNGQMYYNDSNVIGIPLSAGHWKFVNTSDGKITPYLDGVIQSSLIANYDYSAQTFTIGLRNGSSDALVKFKDFEVYSI